MENVDFDKMLQDVIEHPELLLDSSTISNDVLFELQKKINPYVGLTNNTDENNKQIAVCSYTNLREDYLKRLTMTSLVSFVFQMLHEYDIPKKERTWTPVTQESQELFDIKSLKGQMESICTILEQAEQAETDEKKINIKIVTSDKDSEGLEKELYDIRQKKIGIMYTVTNMVRDLGLMADTKIKVTTVEANKYPEIKEIIKSKRHVTSEFAEREFPNELGKEIINKFLKNWFLFDPSIHIRSGIDIDKIKTDIITINDKEVQIDPDDPGHLNIDSIKLKLNTSEEDRSSLDIIMSQKKNYNAALHILRDENLHDPIKYMLDHIDTFKYYLMPVKSVNVVVPPQDTFHRWNYFTEVNYEELRTITECLYPERPDLDWALAIWTTFTGNDQELDDQFTSYCQKNQDRMPSVMKSLEIGKWCFLADFKNNRKNIQFYNKNTEVLKKIIDRHTEDKKIGTELMRNRVRQVKAKNIAEAGPDAPGLKTYKSTMSSDGKDLTSKGAEKVISPEDMKRLERSMGDIKAAKELEVIEEYEKIFENLEDIKKYRDLNQEELYKYNKAQDVIKQAKEMLNVPDDAIQVDVFTNDPKTGGFSKSHFYTKCDEALDEPKK